MVCSKILNLPSADLAFVELDNDFIRLSITLKERKINPGIHLGIKPLENVCYHIDLVAVLYLYSDFYQKNHLYRLWMPFIVIL